ncbi:hypothetical protein SAMN05421821_103200 [Mucilaginibacter lappiensis]|nr:hypothetical protein SAMN05421821_103200 [Mucilaginibacter lappiensis]
MSNQHNNTGITDDDIARANKYKDALDALKNSINGVNSKLPEFADGLQAGLKAIGEKLPEVVDPSACARVSRVSIMKFDCQKLLRLWLKAVQNRHLINYKCHTSNPQRIYPQAGALFLNLCRHCFYLSCHFSITLWISSNNHNWGLNL